MGVGLDAETISILRRLGGGNLSAGIRAAARLRGALAGVIEEIDDYVGYMRPSLQPGGHAYEKAVAALNGTGNGAMPAWGGGAAVRLAAQAKQ